MNWSFGIGMELFKGETLEKRILAVGVAANLLVLGYFKYFSFFANSIVTALGLEHREIGAIPLPIGISFFTFHAISYLVDIYRWQAKAVRSPLTMGLYISLFPQLVAGPIIRFHDVADQLFKRTNTLEKFASGVERFSFGLGKKVLLANPLGNFADAAFSATGHDLTAPMAWLGIACYTLQIYFDFSGYSDMAIGLGRMFGFDFPENFNYPYISKSIREFWRRWHLSLSTWFRDYLYIPLGGNRASPVRAKLNLFIVFFLCGLWHGASWNFVVWGLFHGLLLVSERGQWGKLLQHLPSVVQWSYTMLLIMIGWVFFRAEDLHQAIGYLQSMAGLTGFYGYPEAVAALLNPKLFTALGLAVLLSSPIATFLARDWRHRRFPSHSEEPYGTAWGAALDNDGSLIWTLRSISVFSVLVLSIAELATATYNPFIYFRF
jgi:alginate O-acetyltransferase complex protein AlgI